LVEGLGGWRGEHDECDQPQGERETKAPGEHMSDDGGIYSVNPGANRPVAQLATRGLRE
jgi:hypothetical protein